MNAGSRARFPKGSAHRWWNDGVHALVFQGVATPAVDLDQYLQAVFEVINAGPPRRPPVVYLAHVMHRYRHTQLVLGAPPVVQRVLFPLIVFLGTVLGKYRERIGRAAPPTAPAHRYLPIMCTPDEARWR